MSRKNLSRRYSGNFRGRTQRTKGKVTVYNGERKKKYHTLFTTASAGPAVLFFPTGIAI